MKEQSIIFKENDRPQFHFTPPACWMNDPNGMVFYEGEYHLFYQFHPESTAWGPMHWGHAISKDLVHWEHQPIALKPDHNGYIFSGSAIVDWTDTSGFFDGASGLVAIFTHADTNLVTNQPRQRQSVAYSKDKGRTWTLYDGNPVLFEEEFVDFRDPKLFWYEPLKQWVMVLVAGNHVRLYRSPNLIDWTFCSEFGRNDGSHDGVWECPDLFELAIDGEPGRTKWVLIVSIGDKPDGPEGSRTQYFVGNFDGHQFHNDNAKDTVLWLDHGRDNYAGITWSDIPENDGRHILIGWMSNWKYANLTPAGNWRGAMTIPRELRLYHAGASSVRLKQIPVMELYQLRKESNQEAKSFDIAPGQLVPLFECGLALDLESTLEWDDHTTELGIRLRTSETEETIVGYDTKRQMLFVDRSSSGESGFHELFACRHDTKLPTEGERSFRLRLIVDTCSVEIFANDGQVVITDLIFPRNREGIRIEAYAVGGRVAVREARLFEMKSIYEPNRLN